MWTCPVSVHIPLAGVGQEALTVKIRDLCPVSACAKGARVAFLISRLGKDNSLLTLPGKNKSVYSLKYCLVDFRLKPDPGVCYLYDTVFTLIEMVLLGCSSGLCGRTRNLN